MKQSKEIVMSIIDAMNDEQIEFMYTLLHSACFSDISKGDMMKLAYGQNYSNIDSALPHPDVEVIYELMKDYNLPKFDTFYYVYNYNAYRHGAYDNVAEALIKRMNEVLKIN